jgi:hypothetical protein
LENHRGSGDALLNDGNVYFVGQHGELPEPANTDTGTGCAIIDPEAAQTSHVVAIIIKEDVLLALVVWY